MLKFAIVLYALWLSCCNPGLAEEDKFLITPNDNETSHEEEEQSTVMAAAIDVQTTAVKIEEPEIDAGGMIDSVEAELDPDGSMHIKPAAAPVLNVPPASGELVPLVLMPIAVEETSRTTVRTEPDDSSLSSSSDESLPEKDEDSGKVTTKVAEVGNDFVTTTVYPETRTNSTPAATTNSKAAMTTISGTTAIITDSTALKDLDTTMSTMSSYTAELRPELNSATETEASIASISAVEPADPQLELVEPKNFEPGPNSLAGMVRGDNGPAVTTIPVKAAGINLPLSAVMIINLIIICLQHL